MELYLIISAKNNNNNSNRQKKKIIFYCKIKKAITYILNVDIQAQQIMERIFQKKMNSLMVVMTPISVFYLFFFLLFYSNFNICLCFLEEKKNY